MKSLLVCLLLFVLAAHAAEYLPDDMNLFYGSFTGDLSDVRTEIDGKFITVRDDSAIAFIFSNPDTDSPVLTLNFDKKNEFAVYVLDGNSKAVELDEDFKPITLKGGMFTTDYVVPKNLDNNERARWFVINTFHDVEIDFVGLATKGTAPPAPATTTKAATTKGASTTKAGKTTTKAGKTTTKAAKTTTKAGASTTKVAKTTTKVAKTTTKAGASTTKAGASTTKVAKTTTKAAASTTKVAKTTTKAAASTTKVAKTTTKAAASTTKAAASTTKVAKTTTKVAKTTTKVAKTTTKVAKTTTKAA